MPGRGALFRIPPAGAILTVGQIVAESVNPPIAPLELLCHSGGFRTPMGCEVPTTSWSLIVGTASTQADTSEAALAKFCTLYWRPVYAFFRQKGVEADAAQDLTQGFFAQLLEQNSLLKADPHLGRFRSFLFTCAKNHLMNQRDHDRAAKRGGDVVFTSLDSADEELRHHNSPVGGLTPEQIFDRRWALNLIERSLARLRDEYGGERAALYDALAPGLVDPASGTSYREAGERLGMTEGAVKAAAFRLRKRFGDLLRHEVSLTLTDPAEIEDELRFLVSAVSHSGT